MMNTVKKFFVLLNVKKYCENYRVGIWECPPFVFALMGVIIIAAILVTYLVGRVYASPEILALILCLATAALLGLSYIVSRSFERIALSSREKSEFISIMSHQLRSPLSGIKWQLDLLLSEETALCNEKGKEALFSIGEQNERMISLVGDFLEINRLENKTLVISLSAFSLGSLIKEVIGTHADSASFSKVEINFFPPEQNLKVTSDRDKVISILSRLLDNAIRYSPNGGRATIILEKRNNGAARISVSDEGVGIPEENFDRIFKKFYRGSGSHKFRTEGTGVGLFIVKSLVEALEGGAGFTSIEGKGSTFWFELPLGQ